MKKIFNFFKISSQVVFIFSPVIFSLIAGFLLAEKLFLVGGVVIIIALIDTFVVLYKIRIGEMAGSMGRIPIFDGETIASKRQINKMLCRGAIRQGVIYEVIKIIPLSSNERTKNLVILHDTRFSEGSFDSYRVFNTPKDNIPSFIEFILIEKDGQKINDFREVVDS